MRTCDYCGEKAEVTEATWDGEKVCRNCLDDVHYTRCEECERWVYYKDLVEVGDWSYCPDCEKELFPEFKDLSEEVQAFVNALSVGREYWKDIEDDFDSRGTIEFGRKTYNVIDYDSMEGLVEQAAREYVEKVDLPQIPENLHYYYDIKRRVEDVIANSDPYRLVSSGEAYEETVNGTTYVIFEI